MAQLTSSTPGTLRRLSWLRSLFLWPLMVLLLAGAASYTHGSRYALVHGQSASQVLEVLGVLQGSDDLAPSLLLASETPEPSPLQAPSPLLLGEEEPWAPLQQGSAVAWDGSLPADGGVAVVHMAGPFVEGQALEKDDCERRQAPRGEPAPLKTGTVDPPSLIRLHPLDGETSGLAPPAPELPALTVVELSISRT